MKKKRWLILLSAWLGFLLITMSFFIKTLLPSLNAYRSHNPYTKDTVWDEQWANWHNDVLLYTILNGREVHIGEESWYFDYIRTITDAVVVEEDMPAMLAEEDVDKSEYMYVGHMCVTVNSVLFSEEVVNTISTCTTNGVADLYICEEEIISDEEIFLFHDEVGNLYLKGYKDE